MDAINQLDHAVEMIEKTGLEYAESRSLSWLLQEQRKVVLAEQTRIAKATTVAERENIARCSEVYKNHLEATKTAMHKELCDNARFLRWRSEYESARSKLSLTKKQIEIFKE
jgi:hypothetical protein